MPGWVQGDASREKHRTAAGHLFCRPFENQQPAPLSLYLRSWFGVDLLIISIDIARFIAEAAQLGDF